LLIKLGEYWLELKKVGVKVSGFEPRLMGQYTCRFFQLSTIKYLAKPTTCAAFLIDGMTTHIQVVEEGNLVNF
jgi:hypothetical protein